MGEQLAQGKAEADYSCASLPTWLTGEGACDRLNL